LSSERSHLLPYLKEADKIIREARMKVEDKKRFERLMRRRQLLATISNWFFMRERCNIGV